MTPGAQREIQVPMKRAQRRLEDLNYTFDFRHRPVMEVEPGEPFALETEDAPSGSYRVPDDAARLLDAWYLNYSPPKANPVTRAGLGERSRSR